MWWTQVSRTDQDADQQVETRNVFNDKEIKRTIRGERAYCLKDGRTATASSLTYRRDPALKDLQKSFQVTANLTLEGETKEGYKILFGKLIDTDPSKYVLNDAVKAFFMVYDLYALKLGTCPGYAYVADAAGLSLGHLGRLNPLALKKFIYFIQDAAPIRLKAIHIINTPPALELLMNMIKPFMKKELLDLFTLHSSLSTFEQYIPVSLLPNEVGGKAGNVKEMAEVQYKALGENREWFIKSEPLFVVNESLRVGKSKTASDLFGVEGSFKKLDID
ncbi:hypothetical protein KM043_014005 [Ampulex compressa]|nr:hypothetical protein KM043_014005 [Ampulex compressa]